MTSGEFFLDHRGHVRANLPPPLEELASYLEQDVQSSILTCIDLIEVCSKIEEKSIETWKGTGNAHTVEIRGSSVSISNDYDESIDVCHLPLDQFRNAIHEWMEFLGGGERQQPVRFEI